MDEKNQKLFDYVSSELGNEPVGTSRYYTLKSVLFATGYFADRGFVRKLSEIKDNGLTKLDLEKVGYYLGSN